MIYLLLNLAACDPAGAFGSNTESDESATQSNQITDGETYSPPSCKTIFPEEKPVEFRLTETGDTSTLPLEFLVSDTCHIDLMFFDECCECLTRLNQIKVQGNVVAGDTAVMTVKNAKEPANDYYEEYFVIKNKGIIDLESRGLNPLVKDGMILNIDFPNLIDLDLNTIATGLGLVVNIDGGGK